MPARSDASNAYFSFVRGALCAAADKGDGVVYRRFSDDLWSMAVNVAGGSSNNLSLTLSVERASLVRSLANRAREAGQRFAEQLRAHQRYRATFDELSSLDDRQLADIGVNRSELHRIVALAALDEISAR